MAEPRAKRTHARRSCGLCKTRKTRCELPDLNVPSSSDPLPLEKSCHRCKVLALPCVVDDISKKSRKRPLDTSPEGRNAVTSSTASPRPRPKAAPTPPSPSLRLASLSKNNEVNHSLDLMHGFTPVSTYNPFISQDPDDSPPDFISPLETPPPRHGASMKIHGKPLDLVCAMMRIAYDKVGGKKRRRMLDIDSVDIDDLVDEELMLRIQPGYAQLRTFHPYLEPLSSLVETYTLSREPSVSLLLAIVIYLATLTLPKDAAVVKTRSTLGPFIIHSRNNLILNLTRTWYALEALEILSLHAPYGILPLQLADPRNLAPARGHCNALVSITQSLGLSNVSRRILRNGFQSAWGRTDFWLWLGTCIVEARVALGEDVIVKPSSLVDAAGFASAFLAQESGHLWRSEDDPAVLLGRLSVCDRLVRLNHAHDTMSKIKKALETAVEMPGFNPVIAIVAEYEMFFAQMDTLNARHEELLIPLCSGGQSAWVSYRGLRRRHEIYHVVNSGLRACIACHYLPGTMFAYPNLPTDYTTSQAVTYALNRSSVPEDIMRVIMDSSPPSDALKLWGRKNGINSEESLMAFAELGHSVVPDPRNPTQADVIPLHECMAYAVEAAKNLMEMQAGTMIALKKANMLGSPTMSPSWLPTLGQVSQVMRGVGMMVPDDETGGESVANGCSNIIGSMARTAATWADILEKEKAAALASGPVEGRNPFPAGHVLSYPTSSTQHLTLPPPHLPPNSLPQPPPHSVPHQAPHTAQHQQPPPQTIHHPYMNTSDRWMAGDDDIPRPPPLNQQHQQMHGPNGYHVQQPNLDQVLSEVFGYGFGYQPGIQSQQPPQPQHHLMVQTPITPSGSSGEHGWPMAMTPVNRDVPNGQADMYKGNETWN